MNRATRWPVSNAGPADAPRTLRLPCTVTTDRNKQVALVDDSPIAQIIAFPLEIGNLLAFDLQSVEFRVPLRHGNSRRPIHPHARENDHQPSVVMRPGSMPAAAVRPRLKGMHQHTDLKIKS